MGIDRFNGGVFTGEALTGDIDFFTVHTVVDIGDGDSTVDTADPSGADNLYVLANFIGNRTGMVMTSVTSEEVDLSDAGVRAQFGFTQAGDPGDYDQDNTTVYTLKFATEHTRAWEVGGETDWDLVFQVDGLQLPFETEAIPANTEPQDVSEIRTANGTGTGAGDRKRINTVITRSTTL